MYKTLLSICFLLGLQSTSPPGTGNILYWNENHRLGFADFRGTGQKEDTASSTKDLTHLLGGISKSIVVLLVRTRYTTVFTIYAGMNKDSSWIRHQSDTITLKHEQGHFDLCELYARMLRRDIRKAKTWKGSEEIYDRILTEEESEQENYDRENTFRSGGITPVWKDSIGSRLTALKAYKTPRIELPFTR